MYLLAYSIDIIHYNYSRTIAAFGNLLQPIICGCCCLWNLNFSLDWLDNGGF